MLHNLFLTLYGSLHQCHFAPPFPFSSFFLFCAFTRTPVPDTFTTAMASDALSAHVMQALEVYTKGTKAWFEDDKEAWVSASVKSKEMTDTNVRIVFQDDEDESRVSQHVVFKKTTMCLYRVYKGTYL